MLQKYQKMGLAAAACTLLGMAASEAAVTLTFAQSGANVVATWSGSYDVPSQTGIVMTPPFGYIDNNSIGGSPAFEPKGQATGGTASFSVPSASYGSYVGTTFGFDSNAIIFPVGTFGTYSPVGTMTFASTTLAALGVDSFNNSVAFTGTGDVAGSRQILVHTAGFGGGGPSAVPEPAGAATALVCCVSGLLIRTRQRRRL
jgi:hypothetical protein